MPSDVVISSGTAFKADTVTITAVTSLSGPGGKRKVIDLTGLEDTCTFQGTGVLDFSGGIQISAGCTTATMATLNTHLVADSTFAMTQVLGGKTASGTFKMIELTPQKTVNDKATFTAAMVPTGSITIQN